MNPQLSGLAQNGEQTMIQNSEHLVPTVVVKQIPSMSSSNSPHPLQQQRQERVMQQQLASSSQLHQTSMGLNPQHMSQMVQQQQQMGHPQMNQQPQLLSHDHLSHQQQPQLLSHPKQQSPEMVTPSVNLTGSQPDATASGNTTLGGSSSRGTEASNHLLGKRKIQDLVSQLDPHVKLDPEVEDLLLEMADDFIDSVTSFACTLAKHRNSSTLEAEDVQLHLEKNWKLTIPEHSSDHLPEHLPSEVHQNHLDMVRVIHTSMEPVPSETSTNNARPMGRQGPGNPAGPSHMIRPSPSLEQMASQSNVCQIQQPTNRF